MFAWEGLLLKGEGSRMGLNWVVLVSGAGWSTQAPRGVGERETLTG